MKTNILLLFVWMGLLTSCNSIDDALKPSDDIFISILETQDTVRVVPGDTISFRFMVTTNNGSVRRVEVLANDALFEGHPEKMTFGLIDTSMVLTADEQGYLSRDVSSVIVNYPVYVKPNPDILTQTVQVTFRATNAQGNTGENYVRFKGQNFRKSTSDLQFMTGTAANQPRFFDPYSYRAYSHESFVSTDSVIPGSDEIKTKIALMFGYTQKLISMGPPVVMETHYYMCSPNSEFAASFMADSLHVQGYNAEEMKQTVFYRIEGVGGSYLNDSIAKETDNQIKNNLINERNNADWDYFDTTINEEYLNNLDFSQATDHIELYGGFYAFKTYDNLKGIIWVSYKNNFGNPLPVRIRRYIFQAVATE